MSTHLDDARAQRLLDGDLDPAERRACEAHAAGCPDCGLLLESYRALQDALDGLPAAAPPDDFTLGVMSRIDALESARAAERRLAGIILVAALALGAAALAAAGAGGWSAALAGLGTRLGSAAQAARLAGDVLGPVVGAFRLQLALLCVALALPLLVALSRLVPRRAAALA